VDYRQKDWPKWLALVEFAINNKVHSATKVSLFMTNYGRELRMGADIIRKGKVEKTMEFAEKMKKVYKKTRVALKKAQEEAEAALNEAQEEMRRQVDRRRKKWKNGRK